MAKKLIVGPIMMVDSVLSGPGLGLAEECDVKALDEPVMSGTLRNSESLCQLDLLLSYLPEAQRDELAALIGKFGLTSVSRWRLRM